MTAKKQGIIKEKRGKVIAKPKPSRPDYRTQIVVHFQDNIQLPYKADVSRYIKEYNVGPWDQLVKNHPGLTIEPLFLNIKPETLSEWIRKAKEMDPTYKEGKFFQYFKVVCPVQSKPQTILEELSAWHNIKNVSISKRCLNPAVTYTDDPKANAPDPYQKYLNAAPDGIGAKYIWDASISGSDGASIKFIDIETGWTLNHEDLTAHGATCLYGTPEDAGRAHGTGVLGIVCASDNTVGCVGIAPNLAKVDVIAQNPAGVASAILESLKYLNFGDILLIEATNIEGSSSVPVETTDPEFDAIRLATALGIVVIEPGGNGNGVDTPVDFDVFTKGGLEILKKSCRDSGAIIVTAAESTVTDVTGVKSHKIMPWAPFGSRVDCYSWGENITTLSSDSSGATGQYVDNFGGTSGAAAIIAGAAISMQGMVLSEHGYRFSPLQLREILRNSTYGTDLSRDTGDPFNPLELMAIYMPDLQKFASQHLNFPPDLYLRDFVGDMGEPHAGSISCSPDIILKNAAVPDPTAAFGLGSGTEDSTGLNDTAKIGKTNYLYFRVLNQGGMDAANAKVSVYYSVPSTLLTPSLLNYIGEVTIPNVPAGEILTVSSALEWVAPGPTGHYCFVGLVSHPLDPVADPKKLKDWDWNTYYRFIRENNNITWRNFDMEPAPSPAPPPPTPDPEPTPDPKPEPPKKDWKVLEFVSPGLPDRGQAMKLQVLSRLPKQATIMLQAPETWKKDHFKGNPYIRTNKKNGIALIPINPYGNTLIDYVSFRKNAIVPLKLYINLPDKFFKLNCYTIAVRQILDGKEVGRFTWKLGVPNKVDKRVIDKPIKKRVRSKNR